MKPQSRKKEKDLFEEAIKCGIEVGMGWYAKVVKRCLLEGHVYGIPQIDKEPKDACIYCGEPNVSKLMFPYGK